MNREEIIEAINELSIDMKNQIASRDRTAKFFASRNDFGEALKMSERAIGMYTAWSDLNRLVQKINEKQ